MEDSIPLTSWDQSSEYVPDTSISREPPKSESESLRTQAIECFKNHLRELELMTRFIQQHKAKFWTHFALFPISVLSVLSGFVYGPWQSHDQYCAPGGDFSFDMTYTPWASKHIFQITLGFGKLTFAQAKAIDVVWDVVIGRGGQFLLAMICFHVHSKSLNRMLEQPGGSLSYDAFKGIVFDRPSLTSTIQLIRDLVPTRGWRTKASIIWIVVSTLYVVAFPTIVSAMTGYSANVTPYFDDGSGKKQIPSYNFHRAIYKVHEADRIEGLDLSSTYLVGTLGFNQSSGAEEDYYWCLRYTASYSYSEISRDCALVRGLHSYIAKYGADSPQEIDSQLDLTYHRFHNYSSESDSVENKTYNISAPTLKIEQFSRLAFLPGAPEEGISNEDLEYVYDHPTNLSAMRSQFRYTRTNDTETYEADFLNSHGTCDSQATYMWGFSMILLCVFFFVTGLWELGMYAMWHDAFWHCRLDRAGRKMGFYRGVIDISDAIRKDASEAPQNLASDSQIRAMLTEQRNGGRVKFDDVQPDELPPRRMETLKEFTLGLDFTRGWTRTWTLIHWIWFGTFSCGGMACYFAWRGWGSVDCGACQFTVILNLIIAGLSWSTTIFMLLTSIPRSTQWRHHLPFIGDDFELRTDTLRMWAVVSGAVGFVGFYNAISIPFRRGERPNEYEYLLPFDTITQWKMINAAWWMNMCFTLMLWTIAAGMLVVGLFFNVRRFYTLKSA